VSDELLPAVRAVEELEPAVQAFAEATGILAPIRELAMWATDLIRYRRAPHQAKLLMTAAEKIQASGLPPSAVSDKLLRAALEDGAMEDDPAMQERWANLLANAGTGSIVRAAFPRILSELEPTEAQLLDRLADNKGDDRIPADWAIAQFGLTESYLDNLERLELIRYRMMHPPTYEDMEDLSRVSREGFTITSLGLAFVEACRSPKQGD
jgi:hypothetical protein